ncbi:DUF922 domain-containing protein [Lacihabitans lacunae]|uniref:DUF922 domain-containing protein n=1 Tax=Lacihabitans lacunae TaxID=1028214 RepID=A0ABV7YQ60_9BACT
MKLKTVFSFLLLVVWGTSMAQVRFNFTQVTPNLKVSQFKVSKILDARPEKTASIGEIYQNNKIKFPVYFELGIEKQLLTYFGKYTKNSNISKDISIEITALSITETLTSNQTVSGKIQYNLTAYTNESNGLKKLCTNRNSAQYTRTLDHANYSKIQNQMQQALDGGLNFIESYIQKNKSKLEAFALDSRVVIKPFLVHASPDTVFYQQRKVTWDDFRGNYRGHSGYGAAIYTSFGFQSRIYTENQVIRAEISPYVFTDKNVSWAKPEIKNTYALKHEQTHFDICYLMTIEFLKKIKSLKEPTADDLISRIQFEYLEFYRKTHDLQEQYDRETNHSLIKNEQLRWEQKINESLKVVNLNQILN